MAFTAILLLELALPLCFLKVAASLPTLGHVDHNRLETYENLSDESDGSGFFDNLTFHFTCENKTIGFYADAEYDCRVFHACDDHGKGFPVICPNDTLFDQKQRICTDEGNVDCERAHEWYYLNELPYSVEVDDITETYNMLQNEEVEAKVEDNDDVPSVLPLDLL